MSDPSRHLLVHRAPPGLLERALRRAVLPAPGWRSRNVALAVAASLLVGLGGGLGLGRRERGEPGTLVPVVLAPPAADPQAVGPAGTPPDLQPVRLVCHAPDAGTVAVAGSWNGWSVAASPMRSVGDGLFTADLRLPSGRYEYMFVVDGANWVPDPAALLGVDDGFGRRNSVIEI